MAKITKKIATPYEAVSQAHGAAIFLSDLYYPLYNDYRVLAGTQCPSRHTNPGGQSALIEHTVFVSACFNKFASFFL